MGNLYSTFNVTQVTQKVLHSQSKGYDLIHTVVASTLVMKALGQNRSHLHTSAQTEFLNTNFTHLNTITRHRLNLTLLSFQDLIRSTIHLVKFPEISLCSAKAQNLHCGVGISDLFSSDELMLKIPPMLLSLASIIP